MSPPSFPLERSSVEGAEVMIRGKGDEEMIRGKGEEEIIRRNRG
jgi:hypothetical protein